MEEEIKFIKKNDTWELSNLPTINEAIGVKLRRIPKARWKDTKQSLFLKGTSNNIGMIMMKCLHQLLVWREFIFLFHSNLNGVGFLIHASLMSLSVVSLIWIYLEQPMGFAIKGQEKKVLKLKKTLYSLKQAPRAWNNHIHKYFQDNRFVHCQHEYALYVKKFDNGDILLVCLYVNDLIFTRNNPNLFEDFKKVMSCEFEMIDIELMSYYLGLELKQINNDTFVSPESYA
ncbi:hypothetical protein CR513_51753, partial [Mucuna pruriens]